ncbi:MAG: outer membrane lipoprotein carrier protein LolA [Verrucomicrobiales bacterium]|nr:outer membrane lipoprotein carrier protein LolA [Verrucomicrobiales bacterium]
MMLITLSSASEPSPELDLAPVDKWMAHMKDAKTVEATFVQQRFFRTLRKPLSTPGHLWLEYPDNFRWELGDPVTTIAIRQQDIMTLMEPKKKKAQRFSLAVKDGEEVPDAMHSTSKTFPRSMEELLKHFEILDLQQQEDVYELTLKPIDKSLKKTMRRVLFFIDVKKFFLHGFEIQFKGKSRLRTTFTELKFNQKIDPKLLQPDLTGYKVKDKS